MIIGKTNRGLESTLHWKQWIMWLVQNMGNG